MGGFHKKIKRRVLLSLTPDDLAAKVSTYMNYWFSDKNLLNDEFMKNKLLRNKGWIHANTLLTFPKLKALKKVNDSHLIAAAQDSMLIEMQHVNNTISFRRRGVDLSSVESLQAYCKQVKTYEKAVAKTLQVPLFRFSSKAVKTETHINANAMHKAVVTLVNEARLEERPLGALPALGLDVEYATVDKGGKSLPALLSLCNSSRVCLLWIDKLSDKGFKFDSLPPSLADLLQDQSIMKVGSGIVHDARSLMDTWRSAKLTDSLPPQSFNIQGLVEISEIDQLEFQDELRRLRALDIMGIQAMTIASLGRRLKKQKVSRKDDEKRSHWRAKSMTETMTLYAAEDVYAGLKIYQSLTSKLTVEEMNRIPRATVAFRD